MSNLNSVEIEEIAETLKALGNASRLKVLFNLAECCPPGNPREIEADELPRVGQLGKDLQIAPSTLSHHIKELRRAGLIRCERRGQNVVCSLDVAPLGKLWRLLEGVTDAEQKRTKAPSGVQPPTRAGVRRKAQKTEATRSSRNK